MSMKVCFCGSYPRARVDDNGRYWFVKCGECDRASIHSRTREEAIEAWNIGGEWPASAGEAGTATDSEAGVVHEHATGAAGDAQ